MMDDPRCCEREVLVYECTGPCGRREERPSGNAYLAHRTCGECWEEPRGIFPSTMKLLGLYCPDHGWQPAPHLRQTALF